MAERITSIEDIEDFDKFIESHYAKLEELAQIRSDLKALQKEADALREVGSEENLEKWKQRALKQAAKSALEGTGVKDAERILKYINLEGVDFDDNEALTGFDDKLGEVKTDFPELFDAKRRAGRQSADIHAGSDAPKVDPFRESIKASLSHN